MVQVTKVHKDSTKPALLPGARWDFPLKLAKWAFLLDFAKKGNLGVSRPQNIEQI